MSDFAHMSIDGVYAESQRRLDRRRRGLPLAEAPTEAEKRKSDLTVLEIAQGLLPVGEDKEQTAGDRFMGNLGYISIHFSQARASHQTPGIPDRKYYHLDRRETLWWEAKASDGKQRKAQRKFQIMAERCGEVYVLGTAAVLAEWVAMRWTR